MPTQDSASAKTKLREYFKALKGETLFGSTFGFLTTAALVFLNTGHLRADLTTVALGGSLLLHLALNIIFFLVVRTRNSPPAPEGAEIRISAFTWVLVGSAALFFSLALSLSFWLAGQDRPLILLWLFGGIGVGLLYILTPSRWRCLGPGQVVVFLSYGPLLTTGAHYALSGTLTLASVLVGLPQALFWASYLGLDPTLVKTPEQREPQGEETDSDRPQSLWSAMWVQLILSFLALAALAPLVRMARVGWLALLGLAVAPLALSAALELIGKAQPRMRLQRARTKTMLSYVFLSLLLLTALVGERFLRS